MGLVFSSDHLKQIQDMLGEILLMVEILHQWDKLPIYWLVGFPSTVLLKNRSRRQHPPRENVFFFPMIKLIFLGAFKPSILMGFGSPKACISYLQIYSWLEISMSNPAVVPQISKDAVPARHTIAWSQSEEDLTLRVLVETWLMGSFDPSGKIPLIKKI